MSRGDWKFFIPEDISDKQKDSISYLCEYYNVSREEAVELGTRKTGRKPNLPGSKTCKPVKDMTHEDIWSTKNRDSVKDIFDFYVDQGAWSTFRQTIRHQELVGLHKSIWNGISRDGIHIVEYGCGVAPFSTTFLEELNGISLDISLSDVEKSEHFIFGNWKLNKMIEDLSLENVNVHMKPIKHNELPKYDREIDFLIMFEVLEHVPSPISALSNLTEQMADRALYLENFKKHERKGNVDLGPDLSSAAEEREKYYDFLEEKFILAQGPSPRVGPNDTRLWIKR